MNLLKSIKNMEKTILKKICKAYFLPPNIRRRLINFVNSNELSNSALKILIIFLNFYENKFKEVLQKNISEEKLNDFVFFSKSLIARIFKNDERRERFKEGKKLNNLLNNL